MSGFLCLVFIKKHNENRSLKCKPETTLVSILQFRSHSLNMGFPTECHIRSNTTNKLLQRSCTMHLRCVKIKDKSK